MKTMLEVSGIAITLEGADMSAILRLQKLLLGAAEKAELIASYTPLSKEETMLLRAAMEPYKGTGASARLLDAYPTLSRAEISALYSGLRFGAKDSIKLSDNGVSAFAKLKAGPVKITLPTAHALPAANLIKKPAQ